MANDELLLPGDEGGTTWPRARPIRPRSAGWRYRKMGPADAASTLLMVLEPVLRQSLDYSRTDLNREVGGVLVGGHYVDASGRRPIEYVEIFGFLPAIEGRSGAGNFQFTFEAWEALTRAKDRCFGDHTRCLMLGWFHTHPGIGLFLSGPDRFIHQSFYPQSWMPALVVDPRREELEFFRMIDGRVEPWGFYLLTPPADWQDPATANAETAVTSTSDAGRRPRGPSDGAGAADNADDNADDNAELHILT